MPSTNESTDDIQPQGAPSLFSGMVPAQVALNELRLRLLDLSGRNRLVNFKHSPGKSLQFVHNSIEGVFRRLTEQSGRVTVAPVPEPGRVEWVVKNGRSARPESKDFAARLGINTSYTVNLQDPESPKLSISSAEVQTLFYAEDLGKHCRKLEREAKLAIEETGSNMLYLVLGFLEFPEAPGSDKMYLAPLLCVPVALSRTDEGQYSTFHLSYTGEELADNLSLREKLKRDFGLNLPEYNEESGNSVVDYLDAVRKAFASQPEWHVRRMMSLTLLSFANMLLVRDLDPALWPNKEGLSSLLDHPLVKQVFEGKAASGESQYAEEYSIDEHPKSNLPLIYDADSSQHSALIDVMEGQNRVIEGPPGTGKSQTITNLIAAGLRSGKKILFVAEKMAALEVVRSRLTLAGLDPFVLELHSNKTSKKRILEDIATRINMRASGSYDLPDLLARQEEKRAELKAYADLVNTQIGNALGLTLHQVMWRCERHRLKAKEGATAVQHLDYIAASRTTPTQLSALADKLRYLANQQELIGVYGPAHPLWGFFPEELRPEDDITVQRVLRDYAVRFAEFSSSASCAATLLGSATINLRAQGSEQLLTLLASIAPADSNEIDFGLLPALFSDADPQGQASLVVLQDVQTCINEIVKSEDLIRRNLLSIVPASAELCTRAFTVVKEMANLGVSGMGQDDLRVLMDTLSGAATNGRTSLERLASVASRSSLPFDSSRAHVQALHAIVTAAAAARAELLDYRHSGLYQPGAQTKLRQAKAELNHIQERQTQLEALFYLDTMPAEEELVAAVRTLREGDTWYRVFQGRWRQALSLHKRLEKKKSKKTGAERLRELELLLELNHAVLAWNSDMTLQAAAGPHFKGKQTPLDALLECADWVSQSRDVLEGADVPKSVFDPVTEERGIVTRLASQSVVVDEAVNVLSLLEATNEEHMQGALPWSRTEGCLWSDRLQTVDNAVALMRGALDFMVEHLHPGASADSGLAALSASRDLASVEGRLAAHEDGAALLGNRLKGRQTQLDSAFGAHTYGALIKKAKLPPRIEGVLISGDCVENHRRLMTYTDGINKGWQALADFSEAMTRLGRFDASAWVDPADKPTSEYAAQLANKTQHAADSLGGLLVWTQYIGARTEVRAQGLDGFLEKLESGAVNGTELEHAFIYRFFATLAKGVFDSVPALKQFSGVRHSAVRRDYAELDKQVIKLRGQDVARECRAKSKPPVGRHSARVDEKTEMKLLEHLIPQQRPRVPVRQLMRRAGVAIQELKPCFMMGPQAVAQYLVPGLLHFDIIVMDEASQLRPEQAIGAIARGTQLVVVGDPKQLPPTSFFSRMASVEEDDSGLGQLATLEAESILDVCISHFQPVRTLRWHYRSHHDSLIAFSNQRFYRGDLVVFPSPYPKSKSLGLSYQYVGDGVYENQMNHVEARRVVEAAVEHILQRPHDSLGIVTLNIKQRDLVAELLEARLPSLPEAAKFKEKWDAEAMGLFIKNLENVQGDERDCIFISTTFGKAKDTDVVRQNFGPISREGGWRRLNVLFTRARKSVTVFSSMRPEDIVSDNRTPEGTRALRDYLEFARDGVLPMNSETGLPPDSDFEIAVMDVLRNKGYEVTPQLGVAGFRIDLAVKHPVHGSGYLAAIECDGASYHSGVSVRDRDRIRQEILESLGWKDRIWRIWSTDWFRNPLAETARLLQFLDELRARPIAEELVVKAPVKAPVFDYDSLQVPSKGSPETPVNEELVFDEDEEDLEVQVGDLVTYAPVGEPDSPLQVRLTMRQTDPKSGLIAETTPLGSILIGANAGELVVLRVPGQAPQAFVIQSIRRH